MRHWAFAAKGGRTIEVMTAGSAPPAAVIAAMEAQGFHVTHAYGLTETYGPAVSCAWHDDWDTLPPHEQATLKARQGVPYPVMEGLMVADPETLVPCPADGQTLGEVFMRGNITMKGYLKNPRSTQAAFAGGWFHSGDLAVMHSNGYIELKDRSKDIIISGGENISTIEVEGVLYQHPAVLEAAVVARPDETWGEAPLRLCHVEGRLLGDRSRDHRLLPRESGAFQSAQDGRVRPVAQDVDRQGLEVHPARARGQAVVLTCWHCTSVKRKNFGQTLGR